MKIALYIEDGLEQIVLTPENATERDILRKLHDGDRDLSILKGAFYRCRGGWIRQGTDGWFEEATITGREGKDDSTMIVLTPKPPPEPVNDSTGP